jgi:DNA-binding HxlR family transcriptional regulator
MKLLTKNPSCVERTLCVLGDKWTALVIRSIASGNNRFSKIEKEIATICPRSLAKRLANLEENQIISKKAFSESPPRIEYYLTQKGRDLLPILNQMSKWGEKYH